MAIKFYNVRKKASVEIAEEKCKKVVYRKETASGFKERYAFKSEDEDGTKLTVFCGKAAFDEANCPIAE
jgi:hypothetical protein